MQLGDRRPMPRVGGGLLGSLLRDELPPIVESQARIGGDLVRPWHVFRRHGRLRTGFIAAPIRPETEQHVRRRLLFERSRCMNTTGTWADYPWLSAP